MRASSSFPSPSRGGLVSLSHHRAGQRQPRRPSAQIRPYHEGGGTGAACHVKPCIIVAPTQPTAEALMRAPYPIDRKRNLDVGEWFASSALHSKTAAVDAVFAHQGRFGYSQFTLDEPVV
jgi:hypothetical protein